MAHLEEISFNNFKLLKNKRINEPINVVSDKLVAPPQQILYQKPVGFRRD